MLKNGFMILLQYQENYIRKIVNDCYKNNLLIRENTKLEDQKSAKEGNTIG